MRKTICASVLVWALCVPTLAGDILNPPAPATFDDSTRAIRLSDNQSADDLVGDETADPSVDSMTAAAMTLLDTVLALL